MSHIDYSNLKECSSVCRIVGCGYSCKTKVITQLIIQTDYKCDEIGCLHSFRNVDEYKIHLNDHIKNNSKIINLIIKNNPIISDNGIIINRNSYNLNSLS